MAAPVLVVLLRVSMTFARGFFPPLGQSKFPLKFSQLCDAIYSPDRFGSVLKKILFWKDRSTRD